MNLNALKKGFAYMQYFEDERVMMYLDISGRLCEEEEKCLLPLLYPYLGATFGKKALLLFI